ncbi:gamma-glutamylcyclotransferase, partial [Megasphaera massiliensis]|nr:gamma-glutamylcyclotransferase [Megasphaera massiliensis]
METDDGTVCALVYIMRQDRRFRIPEDWYYQNMEQQYRKFGFDLSVLRAGLRHSRERMEGTRERLIAMDDRQA